MGKIRVKTLGEDESEKEQKKRDVKRRASKRAKKQAEPEKKAEQKPSEEKKSQKQTPAEVEKPKIKKAKQLEGTKLPPNRRPHVRSKRYTKIYESVDRTKRYELSDAIKLVKDTSTIKFNGTIEAHFNLTKKPKDLNLKSSKNPKDPKFPNISYENKFPLAHAKVGSVKDADVDVKKQLDALIKKIGVKNITKLTLSSTMGPGVKVNVE